MDLITSLLTLPYAPVRGLTALVGVIAREAESRRSNPANVGRELEELDRAAEAGEISAEERDESQRRVLEPLTAKPAGRADPSPPRRT